MNWKRTFTLLLFVVMSAAPLSAQTGQPEPLWTAWLYDFTDDRMLLVADDGRTLQEFTLPAPFGFNPLPSGVAVSNDGAMLAYVATNSRTEQLLVLDTVTQRIAVTYDFSGDFNSFGILNGPRFVFNEDGSALAFGYSRDDGRWEIVILDISTADVIDSLQDDGPGVSNALIPESSADVSLLPMILMHHEGTVVFTLIPTRRHNLPPIGAYEWSIGMDWVSPTLIFGVGGYDVLPETDEVIRAEFDPSLPRGSEEYHLPNVLIVTDSTTYTKTTFFVDDSHNRAIGLPLFVQGGERILFTGIDDVDGEFEFDMTLLERDGSVLDVQPSDCTATGQRRLNDGFLVSCPSGTGMDLLHVDTTNGTLDETRTVWTSDEVSRITTLIWAGDNRPVSDGPFMEWAQVVEPVYIGPE